MTNPFQRRAVRSGVAVAGLAIALVLTWAPETAAYDGRTTLQYNGTIEIYHRGTNWGIGARCYDNSGVGLGNWARAGNLGGSILCYRNNWGREPRYAKIQPKNFWGQDSGSYWRVWRDCPNVNEDFCIVTSGSSHSARSYGIDCDSVCEDVR